MSIGCIFFLLDFFSFLKKNFDRSLLLFEAQICLSITIVFTISDQLPAWPQSPDSDPIRSQMMASRRQTKKVARIFMHRSHRGSRSSAFVPDRTGIGIRFDDHVRLRWCWQGFGTPDATDRWGQQTQVAVGDRQWALITIRRQMPSERAKQGGRRASAELHLPMDASYGFLFGELYQRDVDVCTYLAHSRKGRAPFPNGSCVPFVIACIRPTVLLHVCFLPRSSQSMRCMLIVPQISDKWKWPFKGSCILAVSLQAQYYSADEMNAQE